MQSQTNKLINLAREGKIDAFGDTFQTTVIYVTKRVIYPLCQYMSNDEQLDKCMNILANEMALTETKNQCFYLDINILLTMPLLLGGMRKYTTRVCLHLFIGM